MHIPDGFLDARTAIASGVVAAGALGLALRSVNRAAPARKVPLIGLASAFVFAAQMLNFPVAAGTSGHLIGGTLVAVLLGPAAATVVMTAVLVLQCLMYADGGLTALGANVLLMGIVAPWTGYAIYRLVCRAGGESLRVRLFGTAFGAWCSTVAASAVCSVMLAGSGAVTLRVGLPVMAGVHMLIGIGEAVITTLVVAAVARLRPELLAREQTETSATGYGGLVAGGAVMSLGLAIFVSPLASSWPDGLEKAAERLGFATRAAESPILPAPMPDYAVPGLDSLLFSTLIVGGVGTLLAFVFAYVLARLLTRRTGLVSHGTAEGIGPGSV